MRAPNRLLWKVLVLLAACALGCGGVDEDGDGYFARSSTGSDCDDHDPGVHPLAEETCNGKDDDCDGEVDDFALDANRWFMDADHDGYGNPRVYQTMCTRPEGHVGNDLDCDDLDPARHPHALWYVDGDGDGYGAPGGVPHESCGPERPYVADNDDDCDDSDPNLNPGSVTWYDRDGDGYGSSDHPLPSCDYPEEPHLDGDCDASDPTVNPGAQEHCDGVDEDCDGEVDDHPRDGTRYYLDADLDGYGNSRISDVACAQPAGTSPVGGDCDDANPDIWPGAPEACDGVDSDCDDLPDARETDIVGMPTRYPDEDGDGFGDYARPVTRCVLSASLVEDGSDCDDADADVHPGAEERCDGLDSDCDGLADGEDPDLPGDVFFYRDEDRDGWGLGEARFLGCPGFEPMATRGGDCDDTNADVYPGAPEICGDGVWNDCLLEGPYTCWPDLLNLAEVSDLVQGEGDYAALGSAVVRVADRDGDGLDDLLVSAPGASPAGIVEGEVLLFSGAFEGVRTRSDALASLRGGETSALLGQALLALGESPRGGEILVSAPGRDDLARDAGVVWLMSTPSSGEVDLADALATFLGVAEGDRAGDALAGGGDLDGDGLADLLVGAPEAGSSSGRVWAVPASTRGSLRLDAGFLEVEGSGLSSLGFALWSGGDIDGDGRDDLVAGAPNYQDARRFTGAAAVFLGPRAGVLSLGDADTLLLGASDGEMAGYALLVMDDQDGDGYRELAVSAPASETLAHFGGSVHIGEALPSGTLTLFDLEIALHGDEGFAMIGCSLADGGDLYGASRPVLLVGAPYQRGGGGVWRVPSLEAGAWAVSEVGALITSATAADLTGFALTGRADFDGDGLEDVLIGVPGYDVAGDNNAGALFRVSAIVE